jgi:pyruvate kinase
MHTSKKTKIVATLGPACSTKEIMKNMIDAGVNVFRINFSHADYTDVKEKIDIIRELNKEFGYTTSILADLQGPKLRVGVMKEDVIVSKGNIITFTTAEDILGTAKRVYMNYKAFPSDVNPGERILLDDGKLIFEVIETDKKTEVKAKVVVGRTVLANISTNTGDAKKDEKGKELKSKTANKTSEGGKTSGDTTKADNKLKTGSKLGNWIYDKLGIPHSTTQPE